MDELDLFAAAIAVADPVERAALLDRECQQGTELRVRIERLIDAHFKSNQFLDEPPNRLDPTAMHRPAVLDKGAVIAGRYKLLELIGEGGMGAVWVAEQTEPVRRKVALKLIKPGMDSMSVLARFEAERQALAMMDHPNIAKVLDGGLAESGRPFFVMEYVKGVPITEYCDGTRLSVEERLNLFVQVCSAVQHAHQKGIIHRDLKPSNILVAPYDGNPVPKVIDFGLAKALHQSLTERTLHTAHETVLGTPLYMSPEQAQLNNLDVDTRTDVYSLGVLLYELLTGTTPLEKQRFKEAAWDEIRRIIREEEPPRPSARLSSTDTLPSLAACRHTEPAKLTKQLRGELDWIVMKALSKERDRRYETASGFAKDLERFLHQEPVSAGPPSAGYKLRKFVQRNRGSVIAASLVLLALVAGVTGTTIGLLRAERERQLAVKAAEAERVAKLEAEQQKANALQAAEREAEQREKAEKARTEAQTKEAEANAMLKFFEDRVFAASRPKGESGGLGHDVSLRGAVLASLSSMGSSFTHQPLVEARLRSTLATTFQHLGDYSQAAEQLERARALYSQHCGPDHLETLKTMNNLAISYMDLNRQAKALKLREETLAARRRVLPPDHLDVLKAMNNLAVSYAIMNRGAEALKLWEEALSAQKRVLPPDHLETLRTMNNLANHYTALNRHAEAMKLREEILSVKKRVLPPDHPEILKGMFNLSISYADLNRHAEAMKLREETLAAQKRVLPPDHPDTLRSMNALAASYMDLERYEDAVKLHKETLTVRKRALPQDHPDTLASMNNLAISYTALNRHTEATKLFEEALAAQKKVLPPDDPETLQGMSNLAINYAALNRHADALKLHEETLAARKRALPADHRSTFLTKYNLVLAYCALNRHAEAIPFIDELLEKSKTIGLDSSHTSKLAALRMQHFQKLGDVAGCRFTTEMQEKLNSETSAYYESACFRAIVASLAIKSKKPDAAKIAKEEADKAMTWLTKAVAAGWKDAEHLKKDADLDFLRDREDFKKLVADLEKRAKSSKPSTAVAQ